MYMMHDDQSLIHTSLGPARLFPTAQLSTQYPYLSRPRSQDILQRLHAIKFSGEVSGDSGAKRGGPYLPFFWHIDPNLEIILAYHL